MHFTAFSAAAILAFATSSVQAVSSQAVLNNCTESMWFTITSTTQKTTDPFEVKSKQLWDGNIVGVGNSLGISKSDQFYSNQTPKMIIGTSTDKSILYWTISHVDGDPFADEMWNATSIRKTENFCQNTTTYDGKVHSCPDEDVVLHLTLC